MKFVDNILLAAHEKTDVKELLVQAGRSEKEISKIVTNTGISHIRLVRQLGLTEFIKNGLGIISDQNKSIITDVDAVIVVSQTYDLRAPTISTQIQKLFGLPETTYCIDVMDGCAGLIKGLSVAAMLFSHGRESALIIAGDINSVTTTEADIGTRILFGDGVTVTRVIPGGSDSNYSIVNDGDLDGFIQSAGTKMKMNGFEVFRFTKNRVPQAVERYLETTGLHLDQFDAVGLHQASKLVVNNVCKLIGYENDICPNFNCGQVGNLGAGSIGAWLANSGPAVEGREMKMLFVGYGAGLSVGVAAATVMLENNRIEYVTG